MADRAVPANRQFRKDFTRAAAQGRPLDTLRAVMEQIAAGERLSELRRPHPPKGDYADCMECHLAGGWLLICREAADGVVFVRESIAWPSALTCSTWWPCGETFQLKRPRALEIAEEGTPTS